MSHYKHLSINEREKILVLSARKKSLREIAKEVGRCVSTVSRELTRNTGKNEDYSAVEAQIKYERRRKKCRRHKLLENRKLRDIVQRLFIEEQWSPEQIANRLSYENNLIKISCTTIYRAI